MGWISTTYVEMYINMQKQQYDINFLIKILWQK